MNAILTVPALTLVQARRRREWLVQWAAVGDAPASAGIGDSMQRVHKSVLFALAIALPITAQGFQAFQPAQAPCFAAGSATYQVSATARTPDYKVKIDNRTAHPDLRLQLTDDPAAADFVLVDDFDAAASNACQTTLPVKTIRVDEEATRPDLTISLAGGNAAPDFKLYVHSARFSHEEAAALFGIMWRADRPRDLANAEPARSSR